MKLPPLSLPWHSRIACITRILIEFDSPPICPQHHRGKFHRHRFPLFLDFFLFHDFFLVIPSSLFYRPSMSVCLCISHVYLYHSCGCTSTYYISSVFLCAHNYIWARVWVFSLRALCVCACVCCVWLCAFTSPPFHRISPVSLFRPGNFSPGTNQVAAPRSRRSTLPFLSRWRTKLKKTNFTRLAPFPLTRFPLQRDTDILLRYTPIGVDRFIPIGNKCPMVTALGHLNSRNRGKVGYKLLASFPADLLVPLVWLHGSAERGFLSDSMV